MARERRPSRPRTRRPRPLSAPWTTSQSLGDERTRRRTAATWARSPRLGGVTLSGAGSGGTHRSPFRRNASSSSRRCVIHAWFDVGSREGYVASASWIVRSSGPLTTRSAAIASSSAVPSSPAQGGSAGSPATTGVRDRLGPDPDADPRCARTSAPGSCDRSAVPRRRIREHPRRFVPAIVRGPSIADSRLPEAPHALCREPAHQAEAERRPCPLVSPPGR